MNNNNKEKVSVVKKIQMFDDAEFSSKVTFEIEKLFPNRRIDSVLLVAPPDADSSMFNYKMDNEKLYNMKIMKNKEELEL